MRRDTNNGDNRETSALTPPALSARWRLISMMATREVQSDIMSYFVQRERTKDKGESLLLFSFLRYTGKILILLLLLKIITSGYRCFGTRSRGKKGNILIFQLNDNSMLKIESREQYDEYISPVEFTLQEITSWRSGSKFVSNHPSISRIK